MLYAAEHVVIFGGWADSSKSSYYAYQEPGCHTDGPHHAFKCVEWRYGFPLPAPVRLSVSVVFACVLVCVWLYTGAWCRIL